MKVKTLNLTVTYLDNSTRTHYNISRVAIGRFIEYYKETLFVKSCKIWE